MRGEPVVGVVGTGHAEPGGPPGADDGGAAAVRRGTWRMGLAVSRAGLLRGVRILGPGQVHEMWHEGLRARLLGDAPRGVYHAVRVVMEDDDPQEVTP